MKNFGRRLKKIGDAMYKQFGDEELSGHEVRERLMEKGHEELANIIDPDETISIRRPDGNHNRRVREISTAELMWICLYGNR